MKVEHRELARMVAATLLSLAIYNIATHFLEWGSTKCPWDPKKVKLVTLIVIAVVSVGFLYWYFKQTSVKDKVHRKRIKALVDLGSSLRSSNAVASAPAVR